MYLRVSLSPSCDVSLYIISLHVSVLEHLHVSIYIYLGVCTSTNIYISVSYYLRISRLFLNISLADVSLARCLSNNQVFDLRAEGSVDEDAWAELVSEDLRLTMPITPYRSFSPADVVNNRRVLLGVDGERLGFM